jgi:hypothetical protein
MRKEKQNTEDKRRHARGTQRRTNKKRIKQENMRETMQRSLRTKWASKSFLHRILKLLNLRIPKPETANGKLSLAKHLT